MKSRILVCALAAATLSFSSLSFAQGPGRDRGPQDRQAQQHRADRDHDRRGPQRWDNNRRDNHRADNRRGDHRANQFHYGARGPEWRRGGHVPREYRSRQYVVNDWRSHRLSAPPRGHQWVQVGGDYVLMAVATGLIVNLLLNQ